MAKVVRILLATALVAVVAAGCGSSARPQRAAAQVPRALAQDWEGQASAVATAAAAGKSCQARRLARSLRDDVVASESKLPPRLRSALLTGVNRLADRITCTPVVTKPKPPHQPKPPPKKGPKPKPPGHKGHDKGDDKGHDK